MRCLTLAERLRKRDIQVQFICREHPGHLCQLIMDYGFDVMRLPASAQDSSVSKLAHSAWLGVTQEEDANQTVDRLGGNGCDWMIVDHYGIDIEWESRLRPYVDNIAVIDDLADRSHDCDLLIDQNHGPAGYESRYYALLPAGCETLVGARYALLRPEFAEIRAKRKIGSGVVKRIMVFFGGVDASAMTLKAINGIAQLQREEIVVDVVVGLVNKNRDVIHAMCEANANFIFHDHISNIAEVMSAADLFVGGGGGTMWERCCLGIPTLLVSVAENQSSGCQAVSEAGAGIFLGEAKSVTASLIANAVNIACASPTWMRSMARRAMELVDGLGAERVAKRFVRQSVVLRSAVPGDCDSLYAWRNSPEVRRYSADDGEIDIETHRRWFRESLSSSERAILIGEVKNEQIGVIRYDRAGRRAIVSVYLVPGKNGLGFGTSLLKAGTAWVRTTWPEIELIEAQIFTKNTASVGAFKLAGYSERYFIFQANLKSGNQK